MASRRSPSMCALVGALLVIRSFAADLPSIRLDSIFPPGGKAGTEIDAAAHRRRPRRRQSAPLFSSRHHRRSERQTLRREDRRRCASRHLRCARCGAARHLESARVCRRRPAAVSRTGDQHDRRGRDGGAARFHGRGHRDSGACGLVQVHREARPAPAHRLRGAGNRLAHVARAHRARRQRPRTRDQPPRRPARLHRARRRHLSAAAPRPRLRRHGRLFLPPHARDRPAPRFRLPALRQARREGQLHALRPQPSRRHPREPRRP